MTHANDPPPLDEADLHAWVDGRLSAEAAAEFEALLARHPEEQRTALAWRAQRDALQQMHAGLADEPLPPVLRQAAERLQAAQARQTAGWRLGGMAAAVLLAFGLGWGLRGVAPVGADTGGMAHALAPPPAADGPRFARQAAVAHAVFQPEQRHPVEVGADQQAHLVQWLSRRLGRPLSLPVLQDQGYALMGGRLLPGDDGARAQFMYQNAQGQRITLYLGALPEAEAGETAFRYHADGPVPAFYWVDQGFGYALSGPLSREALLTLATAVYRQL